MLWKIILTAVLLGTIMIASRPRSVAPDRAAG